MPNYFRDMDIDISTSNKNLNDLNSFHNKSASMFVPFEDIDYKA